MLEPCACVVLQLLREEVSPLPREHNSIECQTSVSHSRLTIFTWGIITQIGIIQGKIFLSTFAILTPILCIPSRKVCIRSGTIVTCASLISTFRASISDMSEGDPTREPDSDAFINVAVSNATQPLDWDQQIRIYISNMVSHIHVNAERY